MKRAYTNCNMFDGNLDSELKLVTIVVEDDTIIAILDSNIEIDEDCLVIDMKGKYVIPGLINLHAHLFGSGKPSKALGGGKSQERLIAFCSTWLGKKVLHAIVKKNVKNNLLSGVTTLRTSGDFHYSDVIARDEINAGKYIGPRMIVPGPAITVSGGHGDGTFAMVGNTKEELEALVELNASHNVDYIKICTTGGVMDAKKKGEPGELKMSVEQTKWVCDKAHEYGFMVASHTESNPGVKVDLDGGVDTIEHGGFIDEKDIENYKKKHAVNVMTLSPALPLANFDPSLTKLNEMCVYNSNFILEGMVDGAKKCLTNDILVGLGTDAGCPFVNQYNFWREMVYFTKYVGVTNKFAIYSATKVNATIIHKEHEIGTLEVGKKADFIAVSANPIEDLTALRNVEIVVKGGKLYSNFKIKKNKEMEDRLDTLL